MKRRTSLALPILYTQARRVATATKPGPTPPWNTEDSQAAPPTPNLNKWAKLAPNTEYFQATPPASNLNKRAKRAPNTEDSQATLPAPNLNKWAKRAPTPRSPTPSSSKHPFDISPTSPENQWGQPAAQGPSSSSLGARLQSDAAQWAQNTTHNLAPAALPRWRTHSNQQNASTGVGANQDSRRRLGRDEAPHKALTSLAQLSLRVDQRDKISNASRTTSSQDLDDQLGFNPETGQNFTAKKGVQEEDREESALSANDVSLLEADAGRGHKLGREKANYKTRGSIASHFREQGAVIPAYSRTGYDIKAKLGARREKERIRKAKSVKKVNVDVFIPSTVSVGQLARLLNVRMGRLQQKMVVSGMEKESSHDHILTSEYAALLAEEFNRNPVINDEAAFDIYPRPAHPDPSTLPLRPPIVTIMGHVDHGKTTLLDTLRSASVAKGEAGGITQHIGAFSVPVPVPATEGASAAEEQSHTITFLDTPGHAAFSAMRARGAGVTDIIVLVVAADDGVMPQTREVIELTRKVEGKVGVVVAINKVDKPSANVDNVTHALMAEGIQLESYGGDTPGVEVSGLTGQGLDNLVETLSAMAEMQDLRAERDGQVHGYVLESNIRKGLGPVATVLILRGCLTTSAHIIAGTSHGKVRIMSDSAGAPTREAYPGMAVAVSGWKELPNVGDEVLTGSEADVKKALANRRRKAEAETTLVDMEALNTQRMKERRNEGSVEEVQKVKTGPKELRLVIKGDVSGSVEAIEGALQGIGNKDAVVKIVSTGVGDVSESDVMMAKAAEGMIIAFSVNIPRAIETIAASSKVSLYTSTIIYRVMEEVRSRVTALLPAIIEKKVTGEANVLELFNINIKGRQMKQIAGCRVINGLVEKSRNARVVRDGVTVHEGSLHTLKHGKRDMTEIRKGMECGLSLVDFEDLRQDDLIQMYEMIEKPGVL